VTLAIGFTTPAGSSGTDWSNSGPTYPVVGANFGASGTYANYVLIKTVPLNNYRCKVEVMNLSTTAVVIVKDDGTAAAGSALVNPTSIPLGVAASIGALGGSWNSTSFKGRLQIYAASGSPFVSISEE